MLFFSIICLIILIVNFTSASKLTVISDAKGESLSIQQSGILDTNGNKLDIESGGISIYGILNAGSSEIYCGGDWIVDSDGMFKASTSTVVLDGSNQTVSGNTTFYSLKKFVSAKDTIYFDYNGTQTIIGSFNLQGKVNNLLSLRSTQDDVTFGLIYSGEDSRLSLSYLDVKDADTTGGKIITAMHSVDSGNNINWVFSDTDIISAYIKTWLEGPYDINNHSMKTTLRENSLIPNRSPYNADPIAISNIPINITDWVLVELRESANGPAVVSKSMFLENDGDIIDTTGAAPEFPNSKTGDYFVVIRHRNHLDIMSKTAHSFVAKDDLLTTINLVDSTNVYGKNSMKELETGVWGMYSGDASQDGKITSNDYDLWYNVRIENKSGYLQADMDLSGTINSDDYDKWYNTRIANATSRVPEEE